MDTPQKPDADVLIQGADKRRDVPGPLTVLPADGRDEMFATAQWGLASLLLSAVVLVLMPLLTVIATLIPMSVATVHFWGRGALVAASILLVLSGVAMAAVSLFALVFALASWSSARSRRLPQALQVAGTVLGGVALLCWLGYTIGSFFLAVGIHNIR
jgi:hypothetical protein